MQTLFVDFDGTICHDRFWRSLSQAAYANVQEILFNQNNEMVADWMRGKYTSEQINQFVAIETGIEYSQLWEIFQHDCVTMRVDEKIFEALAQLRKNYHLVLITGNMDSFDRFTVPALKLNSYFDVIVNSYTEGQLKTDNGGESFLKYLKGSILDAILIEDSEKSCEVFTQLGGTALQVTSENTSIYYLQNLIDKIQ